MSKRLVLCCDGTWNVPDQESGGRLCPTNVTKLALGVAGTAEDGKEQRVFYHRGVGTSRWERLLGGATGFGLSRNVKDTYRFIVENFEPGDELFFFGFSRGAFTARSTAGFVRNAGILRPECADRLDEAYALYRGRLAHPRGIESQLFRRSYSYETPIHFIGVWDTVGALGIPLNGLRWVNAFNRRWQFHDTDLSTTVGAAFQALAIDEKRRPFEPTLWRQQDDAKDQRLEQVWFTGVHCDVGGGYLDGALADIALLWIADRAHSCGLTFRPDAFPSKVPAGTTEEVVVVRPDAMGQLHESRTAFYRLLPPLHRPIGQKDPVHEYAASTAVQRREKDSQYAPPGLVAYLGHKHQVMDVLRQSRHYFPRRLQLRHDRSCPRATLHSPIVWVGVIGDPNQRLPRMVTLRNGPSRRVDSWHRSGREGGSVQPGSARLHVRVLGDVRACRRRRA